jgi:hypothetical protein
VKEDAILNPSGQKKKKKSIILIEKFIVSIDYSLDLLLFDYIFPEGEYYCTCWWSMGVPLFMYWVLKT